MKSLKIIKNKSIIIITLVCIIFPWENVLASTEGNKIAAKGAELSCGTQRIYVEWAYTRTNNPAATKYISAREKYITEAPPPEGDGGEYASCDMAVATIIRAAGVDPNFEPRLVPRQLKYLKNNSDKWKRVGLYQKGTRTNNLEPGDVLIVDNDYNTSSNKYQHIWLYLGKEAVRNGNYDSLEAGFSDSRWGSYYPTLFSAENVQGDTRIYTIYRYNGEDVIQQIVNWGNYKEKNRFEYKEEDICKIIKGPVEDIINKVFLIITIIGILLLIVMIAIDFIKVVTGTEEELKLTIKHSAIRIICIIILLMLPMLVSWTIDTVNEIGIKNSDGKEMTIGKDGESLCKITK